MAGFEDSAREAFSAARSFFSFSVLAILPPTPESRWLNELRLFGTELHDLIQHHIVEEEDQLFRLAESRLTAEDQERLAIEMTKLPLTIVREIK